MDSEESAVRAVQIIREAVRWSDAAFISDEAVDVIADAFAARETVIIEKAASLVPPAMQQWFLDKMRGVERVGGEIVS